MYEYLKGQVTFVCPSYIVVEVVGIGFQVQVANPFQYSSYQEVEKLIYIHQVVREDAQVLYGFQTLEEKRLFLKLISVSGIGPKSALAIMALEDHSGLVQAIETGDANYLTKFPGVGKKTAQLMIINLKGKLAELSVMNNQEHLEAEGATTGQSSSNSALEEALEALQVLGYSAKEIQKVEKVLGELALTSTDDYLRQGLKLLMKK